MMNSIKRRIDRSTSIQMMNVCMTMGLNIKYIEAKGNKYNVKGEKIVSHLISEYLIYIIFLIFNMLMIRGIKIQIMSQYFHNFGSCCSQQL
jgi:hypothetical protein